MKTTTRPEVLHALGAWPMGRRTLVTSALRTDQVSIRSLDGTGVGHDTRIALPSNPWNVSVQKSTSNPQSVNNTTSTQITFDTVTFDYSSGWDTTNNWYSVPASGRWAIAAQVQLSIGNAGPSVVTMFASIYVNGVEVYRGNGALFTNPTGGLAVTLSSVLGAILSLNVKDRVAVYMWHNYGAAQTAPGSKVSNYLHAHLLSG